MYFNFRYYILLTALFSTVLGSDPSATLLAKATVNKGLIDGIVPILSELADDLQCNPLKTITAIASEVVDLIDNFLGDVPLSPRYLAGQIINLISSLVNVTSLREIIDLVKNLATLVGGENLGLVNSLLKALLPIIKNLSCDKLAPIEPLIISLIQPTADNVTPARHTVSDSIEKLNLPVLNNLTDIIPTTVNQLSSFIRKLLCKPLKALTFIANDLMALVEGIVCEPNLSPNKLIAEILEIIQNTSNNIQINNFEHLLADIIKSLGCKTSKPIPELVTELLGIVQNLSCQKLAPLMDGLVSTSTENFLSHGVVSVTNNLLGQLGGVVANLLCKPLKSITDLTTDILKISSTVICETLTTVRSVTSGLIGLIANLSLNPVDSLSYITYEVTKFLQKGGCVTLLPLDYFVQSLLHFIGDLSCEKLSVLIKLLEEASRQKALSMSTDYLTEDILSLKRNVGKQLLALKYDLLCEPTYCILHYIDDFIFLVDNLYCESCQNIEDIISEFIQLIINLSKEPMDSIEDLTRRLLLLLKAFKCTTMAPVELLVEKLLILIRKLSCKQLSSINDLLEASNRIRKINLT